ncbi:hypothetical protein [Demequina flava]|uniref:hypothetical protein n=1 Tax=Demequina flava TaxID=1095025 RepID=UPI0007856854|nr:hypothetical protein [Demequina flava]
MLHLPFFSHLVACARARRELVGSDRGLAATSLTVGIVLLVGAAATVVYVATDGFGGDGAAAASPTAEAATPMETAEPSSEAIVAPTEPSKTPIKTTQAPVPDQDSGTPALAMDDDEPALSPMEAAFADGDAVVCTYTHKAYDATTTLRSKDVFRIEQQAQGGLAHVIRGPDRTLVWVAGMTEAMEFDTDAYEEAAPARYPGFEPADFDDEALFAEGTCQRDAPVDDSLFELPADLPSAAATP